MNNPGGHLTSSAYIVSVCLFFVLFVCLFVCLFKAAMIVPWPVEQNGKVVPLIGRKGKPNYILEKPKVLHLGVNVS